MRLRKRNLEMVLSGLLRHPSPSAGLEQYDLPPGVAAQIIFVAWSNGHVEGRRVCDLGCGTGILTVGAALAGARQVCGVDLDPVALEVAGKNINKAEEASGLQIGDRIELKEIDVADLDVRTIGAFDTVIQNPPFGVQSRSSDRVFIRKALELAPIAYSLHKGNREVQIFVAGYVESLGGEVDSRMSVDVRIPHQFPFHKKPARVVAADLYLIRRKQDAEEA